MDIGSLPSSPLKQRNSKSKESRKKREKTNVNQQDRDGESLNDNSSADKLCSDHEKTTNINSNYSPSDRESSEETARAGSQKEVT